MGVRQLMIACMAVAVRARKHALTDGGSGNGYLIARELPT